MAAEFMKFKKPYSQYIGKWFENTKDPTIKIYIINVEDIIGRPGRISISMIRAGDTVYTMKDEWGSAGEWWLRPSRHISLDLRNVIKAIFK